MQLQCFKSEITGDFRCPSSDSVIAVSRMENCNPKVCTTQVPVDFIDDGFSDDLTIGSKNQEEISVRIIDGFQKERMC